MLNIILNLQYCFKYATHFYKMKSFLDYELPPEYKNNPVLVRGCFVLKVPDRCYTANNGLSYCWCSTKDLCNSATSLKMSLASTYYGQNLIQYVLAWTSSNNSDLWQKLGIFSLNKEGNILVCFQLFMSAFFWYVYNNGMIHRFVLQGIHQDIL